MHTKADYRTDTAEVNAHLATEAENNFTWYQEAWDYIREHKFPPATRLVLLAIAQNGGTGSAETFAQASELPVITVVRALRILTRRGLVERSIVSHEDITQTVYKIVLRDPTVALSNVLKQGS
jgi:DNA-binding MarR family transcriptional regulator